MPIGQFINPRAAQVGDLVHQLTAEWQAPNPQIEQPVIIEDEQPVTFGVAHQPLHLYVIWDEWADLPQRERSEVIMDAFQATHDPMQALRVTLAMGLTTREARNMGFAWDLHTVSRR